ncbi:MAG: EAL domain-containing protein [Burkholderiales bacterium]
MTDPAAGHARSAGAARRLLRRARGHGEALASDTVSAVSLPPVRLGLLTKIQVLAVAIVFVTAVAITAYTFWREWSGGEDEIRAQAITLSTMLAEVVDEPLAGGDREAIDEVIATLAPGATLAYVAILDAKGAVVASRRYAGELGNAPLPSVAAASGSPLVSTQRRAVGSGTFLEIVAPIRVGGAAASRVRGAAPPPPGPVIGQVQVGMSYQPQTARFRTYVAGALTVVGIVMLVAMVAALLLTRRLVAPMRRLMRAARAVAGGRLDVHVPTRSRDELGLLTHTFNHMTQRLAQSQAEVVSYQRTLEEKVAQRTRELEIATAHAYKLAQHDILTGLPNRSLLNQSLRQIIAVAQREGTQVACLFLDFDHFKRINDTLGHDAGDQLLQAIAQRLGSAVRESDTVARLGGDEFVLVLPGLDPAHATFEVMNVVHRVRESFLAPFRIADQTPTLTCSIGVSIYPLDAQDPATLIKQADTAMYAAKEAGRNAYRFYTADMNARVQQRLQIETDMRRGLMDDEFFLVYQPQVDTMSGRPFGVEALLRWRDPERGVIGPAEFIPIAEESGMIQALGARVLRDACRQVAQWHRSGMAMRLSVNLSVQQLQHDSWLAIVEDALASSGLAAGELDLEITESVIITHPEKAVATLVRLKQMGVSITVDDFGTGYSSLSYLARLPIQGLKIDQRFVQGIERNRNDETITQAIIALAQSLGLRCIAEGVESRPQIEFLRRHGCREAQGFLICPPLEEAELRAWWDARAADPPGDAQPELWPAAPS